MSTEAGAPDGPAPSVRALQDEAWFLRRVLDAIPAPIYVKDAQSGFVFSNRTHNAMIGQSGDALLGRNDADFYPADVAAQFKATDAQVLATGEACIVEEMAARNGEMCLPVLSSKVRMEGPGGAPFLVGINYSLADVRRREEWYRALAETLPVGVVQVEEDGTVRFCNPRFLSAVNLAEGRFGLAQLRACFGQGEAFPGLADRFECSLDADGESRRLLVISSGWLTLGQTTGKSAIISVVDMTETVELRRINNEIQRLNQELAQNMQNLRAAQDALIKKGQLEQLGQLTATIAHELRNPLGAVRTSAFLVERKIKDRGLGVEAQMQRINNGVTRCDAIITQLLDFSRAKKLSCSSADLDSWLGALVEEEARRLPSCVQVHCLLGLGGLAVPFDPSRLQRAVVNLISNAAEAMVGNGHAALPGQAAPLIRIATRALGDWVEISVADNGPGIAEDMLARIREPLFTTKSFGTGLGIPAAEQIAVLHSGALLIDNRPGAGATFTLRLPLHAAEDQQDVA